MNGKKYNENIRRRELENMVVSKIRVVEWEKRKSRNKDENR